MEEHSLTLGGRGRRALALMLVALVGLAVAAGLYLRSNAPSPSSPSPTPTLSSVAWISATSGWVVLTDQKTQRSVLFHTTDRGQHWDRRFATVGGLAGVRFLDANRGLIQEQPASGTMPRVLRTDDGGAHWSPIPLPDEVARRPSAVFFLDFARGWVLLTDARGPLAQDATLYRTENGGQDWTELVRVDVGHAVSHGITETGLKSGPWFRTALDGWIGYQGTDGSGGLYVTHDGGREWHKAPLPEPPGGWNVGDALLLTPPGISDDGHGALLVVDTNRLNAVVSNRSASAASPAPVMGYASRDGGETWQDPRPAPIGADPRLAGLVFVDGYTGWLAGGQTSWVTSDSGRAWLRRGQLPAGRYFAGIVPVDGSIAIAQVAMGRPSVLGDFRWRLVLTEDAGRTWRELPAPRL